MDATELSVILAAIIGGGGLVPFLWRLYQRYNPSPVEEGKRRAEIEAVSSHAAKETVEMMQGVLAVLRQQLDTGHAENQTLRDEQAQDRAKIHKLEAKVTELVAEVRRLGGDVDDL